MSHSHSLKTAGLTPFSYHSDQPLFRVNSGVPLHEALGHASDLLYIAKLLAKEAAFDRSSDRDAWASHYLVDMSKAVIDDAVKVLAVNASNAANEADVDA